MDWSINVLLSIKLMKKASPTNLDVLRCGLKFTNYPQLLLTGSPESSCHRKTVNVGSTRRLRVWTVLKVKLLRGLVQVYMAETRSVAMTCVELMESHGADGLASVALATGNDDYNHD
ncbi:unnamed protein product [Nesidiocoris tenuis]|uniref:Uncharacterized protein n=1 Tax=Nesidiocoris tenuis TaxID=355587 RepID=A0A6H5GTU0_9HEMI|nr:unnamed protein product [Nesidiocoris tenuis]